MILLDVCVCTFMLAVLTPNYEKAMRLVFI